jgi:hypothetical protein
VTFTIITIITTIIAVVILKITGVIDSARHKKKICISKITHIHTNSIHKIQEKQYPLMVSSSTKSVTNKCPPGYPASKPNTNKNTLTYH